MLQLQVASPTSKLSLLPQFDKLVIEISFGNLMMQTSELISVLSTKIRKDIENGVMAFYFNDIKVNELILQNLFYFIKGKSLIINEQNYEAYLTISTMLEMPLLIEKAFFFSEVIDIRNLLFDSNSGIPEKIIADIIASVFDLFYYFAPLKEKLPFFIQLILKSKKLVIQQEDDLCNWLIDYRKQHKDEYDDDTLMLFNSIHAENLSEDYCTKILDNNDINMQMILMEKRLTFNPHSNDQSSSIRYKKRTMEMLFVALVNQFSFLPDYSAS